MLNGSHNTATSDLLHGALSSLYGHEPTVKVHWEPASGAAVLGLGGDPADVSVAAAVGELSVVVVALDEWKHQMHR